MTNYICDLCGHEIDLKGDDGEDLIAIPIKVGKKYEWTFRGHACLSCADRLEAFLKSKPYEERA